MKLKKMLSVTAALVMAVTVFAGCGSSTGTTSGDSDAANGKTYRIATDTTFAPFEFTNDSGEFVGIDVDLLDAIAKDQGFDYKLDSIGFDAALAAVESGQADGFIAGASITAERQKKFDFSDKYYDSTVCAAVKADNTASSLDEINGSTVAVKTGTMSASWAESIAEQYALNLTYFDDSAMMYQAVNSGSAVACFEDYPVMAYGVSQNNGLKLLVESSDDAFATPYGFGVKKDQNTELLDMFNAGLKNIQANGTYDKIVAKYTEAK
jgi:ABC-type amino acid transport substrate-binding protein